MAAIGLCYVVRLIAASGRSYIGNWWAWGSALPVKKKPHNGGTVRQAQITLTD